MAKSERRKCCFDYKGVEFWNQPPFHARVSVSLPHFKYTVMATTSFNIFSYMYIILQQHEVQFLSFKFLYDDFNNVI